MSHHPLLRSIPSRPEEFWFLQVERPQTPRRMISIFTLRFPVSLERSGPSRPVLHWLMHPTTMSMFDLISLVSEGKSGAGGVLRLPAHGQIHSSISELPGAQNLPQPFQGTLHISSASPIAAVAIRARYNERGDFLLSTTPPSPSELVTQDEAFIPQVLDGGGYNTQIVIFGGTDEESSSGNIYFFDAGGQPIDTLVE